MLSSDVLEIQFGPTKVDVLLQDKNTRIIRMVVIATGQVLELSCVSFIDAGVKNFPKVHQTIIDGQSMGKAFQTAGIPFLRQTQSLLIMKPPTIFSRLFKSNESVTVIDVLILVGAENEKYAQILEVYSPAVVWPEKPTNTTKLSEFRLTQFAEKLTKLS